MFRLATTVVVLLSASPAGDEPVVPASMQAELLARVLRYDRTFAPEGTERVKVLVVHREAARSEAFARQLAASLGEQPTIGAVAHSEQLIRFTDVPSLTEVVKSSGARLVIFAPGFADRAEAIVTGLDGLHVVTVSTTASGVQHGIVLGFDLVDGKPRMLFNLPSSHRQHADFRAEVLKLMTVLP